MFIHEKQALSTLFDSLLMHRARKTGVVGAHKHFYTVLELAFAYPLRRQVACKLHHVGFQVCNVLRRGRDDGGMHNVALLVEFQIVEHGATRRLGKAYTLACPRRKCHRRCGSLELVCRQSAAQRCTTFNSVYQLNSLRNVIVERIALRRTIYGVFVSRTRANNAQE